MSQEIGIDGAQGPGGRHEKESKAGKDQVIEASNGQAEG